MWLAFGANTAARVALVFEVPLFSGAIDFMKCIFSPVAYLDEDQVRATINGIIVSIKSNTCFLRTLRERELFHWIFATLVAGVTCMKHRGFLEEREWRIIYQPGMNSSPLITEEIKIISGVPQVIYKLPLDRTVAAEIADIDIAAMFHSLIIGPASQPWVMYEAFTRALKSAGVVDADRRILTSGIPLRSI